jgi:hypothetical protein
MTMTKVEALELALSLAITAPTDEKAEECVKMADELSAGMEKTDVELAMKNALDKVIKSLEEEGNEQ